MKAKRESSSADIALISITSEWPTTPLPVLIRMSADARDEIAISSRSKFGDQRWDMTNADKTTQCLGLNIWFDFGDDVNISGSPLLISVKYFIYSLLVDPPHTRLRYSSISKNLRRGGIRNLVRFMVRSQIQHFRDITQKDFDDFLEEQKSRPHSAARAISDTTLSSRLRGIQWLVMQGKKLPDCLTFDPWIDHRSIGAWARTIATTTVQRGILTTPVIPDNVVSQLIKCSLKEIDNAQVLVQAAIVLRNRTDEGARYRDGRYADGAIRYKKIYAFSLELQKLGFRDAREIPTKFMHLRSAVAILIGLLTGMRPSEILAIPADFLKACTEETFEVGGNEIKSYFINSILSKNLPLPNVEKWQTVPLVFKVIRKLITLNALLVVDGPPFLFSPTRWRKRGVYDYSSRMLNVSILNKNVKNFVEYHGINSDDWDGVLTSRSLRRTCARLLTRNGLGLIELQDQLKHFDPETTRMYGQPSMHHHFSEEKVSYSEDLYQELLEGVVPIVGGGAKFVGEARGEFKGMTRINQKKFIEGLAKKALIDHVEFGLCAYKADLALCGGNKALCKPDLCANSIIPIDTARRALEGRLQENKRLLKFSKGKALVEKHLFSEIKIIKNLLDQARLSNL